MKRYEQVRADFEKAFESLEDAAKVVGLLGEEEQALHMLDDRNLTVHLYDQKTSRDVFLRVKSIYVPIFRNVLGESK